MHKWAFITCLGLPCSAASAGTFGTEAPFKPFPICTGWALQSTVASLASLEGQRLHHPSPQVQQTFPFTKLFHQLLFWLLLTAALGVAIVSSISKRKKKPQSLYGLLSHQQIHCRVRSQISKSLTPGHLLIEAEGWAINIF